MKQYRVEITDAALADMESIYIYIAEQLQSPENAMGQYQRIAEAIESLDMFPQRIKVMDSEPEHNMGLRQLLINRYAAFFIIEGERVVVLRVLYSASDIHRRLFDYEI